MIKDLLEKLPYNDNYYIKLGKYNNSYYGTISEETLGDIYYFSSTDYSEVLIKLNKFTECFKDTSKFFKLLDEVKEPFEVEEMLEV